MDPDSPDAEKDFPGLYSERQKSNDSDFSDESHEKLNKKEGLLKGKKKDKKDKSKDKGYAALGEEGSEEEIDGGSPQKGKKGKAFKFHSSKKEKKLKEKEIKELEKVEKKLEKSEKKERKEKESKKEKKGEKKDKKKVKKEDSELPPIFGLPLDVAVERSGCHDGIALPLIIRQCILQIESSGLSHEGIYRISGVKSKVQQLRQKFDKRENVKLGEYDPYTIASLLKQFLRELPDPILTAELGSTFEEASAIKDDSKRLKALKAACDKLPLSNRTLLGWLFTHMNSILAKEKTNKMSIQNLALVLSPTLQLSHNVLHGLFRHSEEIFTDIQIQPYEPPLCTTVNSLADLPSDVSVLETEIKKQESLLRQLHGELQAGFMSKQRDEQIWEVQRIVTMLKRKLKQERKPDTKSECEEEMKMDLSLAKPEEPTNKTDETESQVSKDSIESNEAKLKDDDIDNSKEDIQVESESIESSHSQIKEETPVSKNTEENEVNVIHDKEESSVAVAADKPAHQRKLSHVTVVQITGNAETIPPDPLPSQEKPLQPNEELALTILENSELSIQQVLLQTQIQLELIEVENLKAEIGRKHKRSNSLALTSQYEDWDLDNLRLESDKLEKENKNIEKVNNELVARIIQENIECCKLKAKVRLLKMKKKLNETNIKVVV